MAKEEVEIFLGHDIEYWLMLQQKATTFDVVDLIQELATLRGRLNFYESRIEQMMKLKESKTC